jgi:hypothetical protein
MKFLPTCFFVGALALAPSLQAAGESLQQILSDAQTAYMRGDVATAKKNFQIVSELDPKNIIARNFLRQIAVAEARAPKGNEMERQLSSVIMPKVEFQEATLASALEYLRQQVTKVSGGKSSVNFVVQLPPEQVNAPVTINLRNVPVTEVIRYLGDLANLKFEYEKYAIKVTPKGGAAMTRAAAAPEQPAAPATSAIPGL